MNQGRITTFLVLALFAGTAFAQEAADIAPPAEITLELIMSDPDWIGNAPERPYWADDGGAVYYERQRSGEDFRDLVRLDLASGESVTVDDAERGAADAASGDRSRDRRFKVYTHRGDVFWKDVETGEIRQLTRTAAAESRPRFLTDERRVAFRRGTDVFVRDLDSGLEEQVAEIRLEKDPAEEDEPDGYLSRQQPRLLSWVRERRDKTEAARERENAAREADASRLAPPFYLGEKTAVLASHLSPDGGWMLLRVADKKRDRGRRDKMANYVSEDGYVAVRDVRPKVGTGDGKGERLVVLDLAAHEQHELDLAVLPGIADDPLAELRRAARERREAEKGGGAEAKEENGEAEKNGEKDDGEKDDGEKDDGEKDDGEKPAKPRAVVFPYGVEFSPDGRQAAVGVRSVDNKDRWIAVIARDPIERGKPELVSVHRLSDEAWINWSFNDFGWLDDERLYFLSEESGTSHLYLHSRADTTIRQLTSGAFVVDDPTPSPDDRFLYYTANAGHPGIYEVHRVDVASGESTALTGLGGRNSFVLSPDGARLLVRHSTTTGPPELYVQEARPMTSHSSPSGGTPARRLTHTVSAAFSDLPWVAPEIVAVASTHHDRPIYSRFYPTASAAKRGADGKRPAVVFVHGAGYLQNAHQGWSSYFREFMFHTFLTRQGYLVLDMDYRASRGYGRDWRTAIYRRMGTPELEDLEDGVAWLVDEQGVDPERVGVYGGSYGGFMAFMALFKEPDLFAAGAALRPVTDWAHYNHPYTSNILNTPEVDPEAYERSSPIEFAEGLASPLLICTGMQDDNVFFQDTVRLVQRLIELEKEDWELAVYPIEPHGFREPSSWLDEYRRVFKLFETHLAAP